VQFDKTPQAVADAFHAALPEDPRAQRRKMFGYPGAFVGGNMFAGTHGEHVIVRLPEAARNELLARPGARVFEPMAGRPMREYVVVPDEVMDDPDALRGWVARAFEHGTTLPARSEKPKKKR
jgi:TfoX/Sxy family transcriptional regulator of competence genes